MLIVFIYLWRGQKQKARDEVIRARREAPNEPGRLLREGVVASFGW
jgi:hypothetical protein